ncbi:unnamed protein product [Rotaria sp. Silwood2]|nr:unnamed protein product [Rotaria sp. Silwood2]
MHAIYRDHVVPVEYALLRRKATTTYRRLTNEILKVAPQWMPQSMMIDFEKACINELGCQNRHQTDSVFAHNIHKIGALTFLEPNNVIKAFEILSMDS